MHVYLMSVQLYMKEEIPVDEKNVYRKSGIDIEAVRNGIP